MPEAGQSFRGRGNGTASNAGGNSTSGAKGKSFGNDYDSYMKDQEQKAEAAASKRKQQREEFDRRNAQQKAEQDRARQQQEQRSGSSRGSGFSSGGVSSGGIGGGDKYVKESQSGSVEKILRDILNSLRGGGAEGSSEEGGGTSSRRGGAKRRTSEGSITAGVIAASVIRDVIGLIGRIPSAKSGFDLITPTLQIEGSAIGAAGGLLFGQSAGGAMLGKEAGAFYGSAITREIQTKTAFAKASARYRALSGSGYNGGDLSMLGVDNIEGASFAGSMASAAGGGIGSTDLIAAIATRKIASIDDALILAMEKQSRTSGEGFSKRSSELLGVAKKLGIRSGLYADVFSQSSSMTDMIAASGANPNLAAISQTMFGLNNIGGSFAIGSPTASGNQKALSQGISNPTSPLAQAMMYSILRRKNPNADFFDLQVMQENAANDPSIMKEFLGQMDLSGGKSPALYKQLLYNNFGQYGLSKTSTKQLAEAGFTPEMMTGNMSLSAMTSAASALTPRLEQQEAQATNAFIISFSEGINTLAAQWVEQMKNANEMIAKDLAGRLLPSAGSLTGLKEGEGFSDLLKNAFPFLDRGGRKK